MERHIVLIFMIAIITLLVPQALADDYMIFVHKSDGGDAQNVKVKVLDGSSVVCSGNTDNDGVFHCGLDSNKIYKITASGKGEYGEWEGLPRKGRINIYMS